jgi:hypothetical protein
MEDKVHNRVVVCICFLMVAAQLALSEEINLGVLSFDVFIPGTTGAPGVNAFNLSNLTGSSALPPDFPALTSLKFLGSSLMLENGASSQTVVLGDVAPGNPTPIAALEFPDTSTFSSAVFKATLNTTTIALSDGTIFLADSPSITASLVPSGGAVLSAGTDLVVISVNGTPGTAVPEPAPAGLLLVGIVLLTFLPRFRDIRAA